MRTSIRSLRHPDPHTHPGGKLDRARAGRGRAQGALALVVIGAVGILGCPSAFQSSGGSGGASTSGPGGSGGGPASSTGSSSNASSASASTSSSGKPSTSSSSSASGGVDAGALGPLVTITHPGTDPRQKGKSIPFVGAGVDPTDGMLSGNALVWTDSKEGQMGTGSPINWTPTQLGSHTITLTGTDSLKYSATDTVTFDVIP